MIQTNRTLTYADLDRALYEAGYHREDYTDERIYRHPQDEGAFITLPPLPWNAAVREYHHVAARAILDSFGIMERNAFDLLIIRLTSQSSQKAA